MRIITSSTVRVERYYRWWARDLTNISLSIHEGILTPVFDLRFENVSPPLSSIFLPSKRTFLLISRCQLVANRVNNSEKRNVSISILDFAYLNLNCKSLKDENNRSKVSFKEYRKSFIGRIIYISFFSRYFFISQYHLCLSRSEYSIFILQKKKNSPFHSNPKFP